MFCKNSLLLILGCIFLQPALAAKSYFIPRVGLSHSYTDNVSLLPPCGEQQEDFVTQVNPGFTYLLNSRRLEVSASYDMENIFYAENSGVIQRQVADECPQLVQDIVNNSSNTFDIRDGKNPTTFHRGALRSSFEFVRDIFKIETGGTYSQRSAEASLVTVDNIGINTSRANVYTVRVIPSLRYKFGNEMNVRSHIKLEKERFRETLIDAEDRQFLVTFDTGKYSQRWNVIAAYSAADQAFRRQLQADQSQYASIKSRALLTAKNTVYLETGYEDNDFFIVTEGERSDGLVWSLGTEYKPTARTNVDVAVGERHFGPNYKALVEHGTRRMKLKFSHTIEHSAIGSDRREELLLSEDAQVVELQNLISQQGPDGQQIPDNLRYLSNLTSVAFDMQLARIILKVRTSWEVRDYAIDREERYFVFKTGADYRLGARTKVYAKYYIRDTDTNERIHLLNDGKLQTFTLGFFRRVKPKVSIRADYTFTQQESINTINYRENGLLISLDMKL